MTSICLSSVFFFHFVQLEPPSEGQRINNFQQNPGNFFFFLVNSPTFFTNVASQKTKWASLSLQEKIKRDLKKRATHGGSSSKKSVRSCSMSSESSCSAMTKDDSFSVDERSTRSSKFILYHGPHNQSVSPGFPFFQATGSRWNSARSFSCSSSSAALAHPQPRVPPIKTTGHQKDKKQKVWLCFFVMLLFVLSCVNM